MSLSSVRWWKLRPTISKCLKVRYHNECYILCMYSSNDSTEKTQGRRIRRALKEFLLKSAASMVPPKERSSKKSTDILSFYLEAARTEGLTKREIVARACSMRPSVSNSRSSPYRRSLFLPIDTGSITSSSRASSFATSTRSSYAYAEPILPNPRHSNVSTGSNLEVPDSQRAKEAPLTFHLQLNETSDPKAAWKKKFSGNIDGLAAKGFQRSKRLSRAGEAQQAVSERKRSRQAEVDRAEGFNTTEKTRESVDSRRFKIVGTAKKSIDSEMAGVHANGQGFKKTGNAKRSIEMADSKTYKKSIEMSDARSYKKVGNAKKNLEMSDTKGYEKTGTMYTKKSCIEMADEKGLKKTDRAKKSTEMDDMGAKKTQVDSEEHKEAGKEKQEIQIEVDTERDCVGREVSSGDYSEDRSMELEEEGEWAKEAGKAKGRQTDLDGDEEILGSKASVGDYGTGKGRQTEEKSFEESTEIEDKKTRQTDRVDSLEKYTEEQDMKKSVTREAKRTDREQYSEGTDTLLKLDDHGETSKEASKCRHTDNLVQMKKPKIDIKKSWQSQSEMEADDAEKFTLRQFLQVTREDSKHTETKKNTRKMEQAPSKKMSREQRGRKKNIGQRIAVDFLKVPNQTKKSMVSKISRQGGTGAARIPEISQKGNIKEAGARKRKSRKDEMMEYTQRKPLPFLLQSYERIMTYEEEEKIRRQVCMYV